MRSVNLINLKPNRAREDEYDQSNDGGNDAIDRIRERMEYDRLYRQKGDDRITNCVLQPPTGKGAAAANYAMEAIKSCQVIKIMSLLWWKSDEK